MAEVKRSDLIYQLDQFVIAYEDAGVPFPEIIDCLKEYISINEDLLDA